MVNPVKNKNRKGIGYIIEAFVAALVIFVFVLGHHITQPTENELSSYQDSIGGRDLGYVLQKTGELENFIKKGRTGSIRTSVSGISGRKLQVTGTINNLPIYRPTIGFYAPNSQIYSENLENVTSSDTCSGDLEEIDSEHPVKKSDGILTNNKHRVTLYVADIDATIPGGFNGDKDYDALWVDNGTECQFSGGEGPFLLEDIFFWGDEENGFPDTHYDIHSIDDNGDSLMLYEADTAQRFKREMKKPVNDVQIQPSVDKFNFSTNLDSYDLLVFHKRETLTPLNVNKDQLLSYAERRDGSILLMMSLTRTDLSDDFLSETGLRWVELNRDGGPSYDSAGFGSFSEAQQIENYYKSLQIESENTRLKPQGKISSGNQFYMTSDQLVSVAHRNTGVPQEYNTTEWNAADTSMSSSSSPPGVPDGCDTTVGTFEFDTVSGIKTIDAYVTELGSSCDDGIFAITPDLDQDGSYTDEETYLDGENVIVEDKTYRVVIPSQTKAVFEYDGSKKVELVNYKTSFPERDIGKFARMNNLSLNSNTETGNTELATAVMYWLLEKGNEFGTPSSNPTALTRTSGGFQDETFLPYKVHMRWYR